TNNTTGVSSTTNGSPYANGLADLQRPFTGIASEYFNLTEDNLKIDTDTPPFVQSGTGDDTIFDNNMRAGDVVIDAGGGTNTIHANSNRHDTIIVDAESDAPLVDVITGLKANDSVLIKGLTALPSDVTNTTFGMLQGLMLPTHLPATGPAAQIFLIGYKANDLA